ncbi:serine hydrolase [Galenea microaerophila]
MKKLLSIVLTLGLLFGSSVNAETPKPDVATPSTPPVPHVVPHPPAIAATAYILMDYDSGAILASKNPDEKVEPASLTKMMTAYIVYNELKQGNIHLDDEVTISKKAWQMPGSKMFIEVGKKVKVEDLIKGMDIQSGNDAAVALAEYIAGSEDTFVELMNRYAQKLGMKNTHFSNATGLPTPDHYSTARDLAILARAIIHDFPEQYKTYAEKKFTFNGITQYNRNKLLWQDPSVDGLKTGHTEKAGYCLVASAKRGDMRLISVVLGTKSAYARVQESQKLLNYGFRFFETHKLFSAGQRIVEARVWEGTRDTVGLGLTQDLYVTTPRGQFKNLQIEKTLQPEIIAPVKKGQPLGMLKVSLEKKTLAERPLVALDKVDQGGFFKRMTDQIKRLFHSLLAMIGL